MPQILFEGLRVTSYLLFVFKVCGIELNTYQTDCPAVRQPRNKKQTTLTLGEPISGTRETPPPQKDGKEKQQHIYLVCKRGFSATKPVSYVGLIKTQGGRPQSLEKKRRQEALPVRRQTSNKVVEPV